MTKKDFKEKLKRGLGSAIIVLERTDNVLKYQDIVLWACLNYTGYDWQCEGSRGEYLYRAILCFEDKEYFHSALLDKFCADMKDFPAFDQLTDLLICFAQDGSGAAREKLYNVYNELFAYVSNDKMRAKSCCYQESNLEHLCIRLLLLDGVQAFEKIIGDLGNFYKDYGGKNLFDFDWFFARAKDFFGKKKVENYLEKSKIRYKKEDIHAVKQKDKGITPTLEDAIADSKKPWLKSEGHAIRLLRGGNADEIEKLTNAVIDEKDLKIKANMLKIFTWDTPFCGDIGKLIDYSKSENKKIRRVAFRTLEKIVSNEVHDYAISLLRQKDHLDEGISILCKNYKNEDSKILTEAVKALVCGNNKHWHGAFSSVCKLIEKNKQAPKELLNFLYKKTLCSFCREYIVRAMNKRKMLTYELVQELMRDSNCDIRDFVCKKIKNAKTEKYLINLQFDSRDHFCIWATDFNGLADDKLLTKGGRIISFKSEDDCRSYAAAKKMILMDESVVVYNLDAFDSNKKDFFIDCNAAIDVWNMMKDAATSVDAQFEGDKQSYSNLYNKIFFGCNLPAIKKDGEDYNPIFCNEEKALLAKVFEHGLNIIKQAIRCC